MTPLFRCFFLVTAMVLLPWNGAKAQTTNYVSDLTGNDAWDGLTWETAKKSIQGAVDAASPGNTVLVTNGIYTLTNQILITNGITLLSTSGTNFTTVDGNYTTRCVSVSHPLAVVNGFTITRGYNDYGSGLLMSAGTVQDCVIISNKAAFRGAGVYLDTGGAVLRCTVQDNSATLDEDQGGGVGICCESGGIVRDSVIIGNVATGTYSALGAGVGFFNGGFMEHSTVIGNIASSGGSSALRFNSGGVATNCTITQNISTDGSGVIRFSGGGALYNCTISTNASPGNAVFSDSYGGAGSPAGTSVNCRIIGNVSGSGPGGCSFMKNCTIAENQATNGNGGGLTLGSGYVAVGCMIVSNTASQGGGGVQMGQGGQLVNCTSTWNRAAWGGGVNCWGGSNRVSGCTITGNSATNGSGGGVAAEQNDEVRDCNVSGNVATEGGGIGFNNGGTASNCFISGNTAWQGGGVNIQTAGMIDHCAIVSNNACLSGSGLPEAGGVRCRQGGLVRNSLIARNSANNVGGGMKFEEAGGIAENCTIAGNSASNGAGGVWFWNGGIVSNSVVYGNQSPGMPEYDSGGGAAFSFSCTTPDPGGLGNIIDDPHFVDAPGGDFRLATNSPCIDQGVYADWMTNSTDLEGKPRIIHGAVDMGAFEAILPSWDTDIDTIPDLWTWEHFGHLTGLADDLSRATDSADGTGRNNLYKYAADLDPTNPLSFFQIAAVSNMPPSRFVRFLSSSNRVYGLKWSTNLVSGSWMDVSDQTNVWGTGTLMSLGDTNPATLRFYKVDVKAP